jgi:hypothetical protein
MEKQFFDTTTVVQIGPNSYRLILATNGEFKQGLKGLSDPIVQQQILLYVVYEVAWWYGKCTAENISLTHVEIILPLFGEYLKLQEGIGDAFKKENLTINVFVGVSVDLLKEKPVWVKRATSALKKLYKQSHQSN